jgi:prepilin-type N-terminal cleavage/methylation domain-containing protein
MTPYRIWRAQRRGYTLVEMLIVVSIMIMLVAVTLPVAKKVMDGSQSREASRQLNAYFAMAKARALLTGRPCGIHFSFPNAPLGIDDYGALNLTAPQLATYWPVRQCTELQLAETPAPYAGSLVTAVGRIDSGTNRLELGGTLATVSSTGTEVDMLKSLLDSGEQFLVRFNFKGDWFVCKYVVGMSSSSLNYIGPLWTDTTMRPYSGPGVPFEILRSPRPAGNPLTLPTGTCVDMTYSGIGTSSRGFLFPPHNTEVQNVLTGLTVLLDPNGGVQSIYVDTKTQRRIFLGPPAGSLHFLVGKTEKAPLNSNLTVSGPNSYANLDESNLADPTALWVVVSRGTGQVTTTENMPSMTQATALASPNPVTLAHYLRVAREAATTGEHMTGR